MSVYGTEIGGFEHLLPPDMIDRNPFWTPWPDGNDYKRVDGGAKPCICDRRADEHGYHTTQLDDGGDRLRRLCTGKLVKT